MIVYCATNDKKERFQIATVPVSKHGVGWFLSNDPTIVSRYGKYIYRIRLDTSDNVMRKDIADWYDAFKEKMQKIVQSGDVEVLHSINKLTPLAIETYLQNLSSLSLYRALHTVRSHLYKNNSQKWAVTVAEIAKISMISIGQDPLAILCWDPSKIESYKLVEITERQ